MSKLRLAAAAVMASCGLMLVGGAGTALAQGDVKLAKKVPVTGESANGKQFTGTYTIKRFIERDGQAYAVGTLRGKLKNRTVTRRGVKMPAALAAPGQAAQVPVPELPIPTPGACTILNLVLGPIDLNLLGLRVATNEIRLLVEAVPGAGNLLGNLLCAITNLLNPQAQTPLAQLIQLLNALLALAPSTPAGTAAGAAAAGASG